MSLPIEQRVRAGAALGILLFAAVTVLAARNTRAMADTARLVTHTQEVLATIESAVGAIETSESSIRAYGLSGDPMFIDADERGRQEFRQRFALLADLVSDNPRQMERLEHLEQSVVRRLGLIDELRRIRDAEGQDQAAAFVATGSGRLAMEQIVSAANAMRAEETTLMAGRVAASEATMRQALATLTAVGVLGVAFLLVAAVVTTRHIRGQQAVELALRTSEQRARLIIDNMLAGLVIANPAGKIELINPAAQQMFGYRPEDIVGRNVKRLVASPDDDPDSIERLLRSVTERGLGQVTEWDGRRSDGTVFPLELSLFEFDADGTRHLAGIIRDISERREIDRMKDEFVSVVSHELRTPLTSIRGALQLVLADRPEFKDPEHEPLLQIALSNCERLMRIINDILDVSKIEAGQVELRARPCAVEAVVEASLQSVREMARAASVTLAVALDRGLPPLLVDFDRIVQVVVNLLSNAVKFSPPGTTVTITAIPVHGAVAISVRDQGPGITRADRHKLFQKFKQLDGSATRWKGGTGLGLSIAKALVEQHGGTISVDSAPGQGSTFMITMPIAVADTVEG